MFSLHPNIQHTIYKVGREQTPIFVIDNFLQNCSVAIQEATNLAYSSDKQKVGAYYPGIRAPVGADYGMAVLRHCQGIFYRFFNVPQSLGLYPLNGSYSLLTTPAHKLSPLQCIPHYDNNHPFSFAMLHYLNKGEFGGTGFYRHKPTEFENITQTRKTAYLRSAKQFLDKHGEPQPSYMTETNEHFDLMLKIDYKPNRLVMYPASLLHSAYVANPQVDVNPDPKTGRLSANFFVEFRPD